MDAAELARWTRFAAKGGIGKCTAVKDCVAERAEDLMFLKGDEITVLLQLPEQEVYLGYCEGVVGRFQGIDVQFHSKLKKPVMTKRASTAASKASPFSSKSPSPVSGGMPSPNVRDSDVSALRVLVSSPSPSIALRSSLAAHAPSPPIPSQPIPSSSGHTERPTPPPRSDSESPSSMYPEDEMGVPPLSSTSTATESALDTPPRAETGNKANGEDSYRGEASPRLVLSEVENKPTQMSSAYHSVDVNEDTITPSSFTRGRFDSTGQLSVDKTFDASEPSTRISAAMSDGEVGIGLSLLQDFANGGDDDWSSTGGRSAATTPEVAESRASIDSYGSTAENYSTPLAPLPMPPPLHDDAATTRSRSSSHVSSPNSLQRSDAGDYWEGASDIYDDYRYSRYSMASRMSISQGSNRTPSIVGEIPPVPRPSTDRAQSAASQYSFQTQSSKFSNHRALSSDLSPPLHTTHLESAVGQARERPAPLDLAVSPLLHTSFGSPDPSPGMDPNSGTSTASPPLSSGPATATSNAGVASALRMRLETERGTPFAPLGEDIEESDNTPDTSRGPIVIDDDEGIDVSISSDMNSRVRDSTASSISLSPRSNHTSFSRQSKLRSGPPSPLIVVNPDSSTAPLPSPTLSSPPLLSPPLHQGQYFAQAQAVPRPPRVSSDNHSTDPIPSPWSPESNSQGELPPTSPPETHGGLRPVNPSDSQPGSSPRRSLFLPHPNAPVPPVSPSAPMYARQVPHHASRPSIGNGSVVTTLQKAIASRVSPNGMIRRTTIYGRCEVDLANAIGPVPISFSTEPFPAPPPMLPVNRTSGTPPLNVPKRGTTMPSPLANNVLLPADRTASPAQPPVQEAARVSTDSAGQPATERRSNVLARANFTPRASTLRPRSRSFSGFNSAASDAISSGTRSSEEGSKPSSSISGRSSITRMSSASSLTSVPTSKSTISPHTSIRSSHAPSPLSLPRNNSVVGVGSAAQQPSKSPSSPLAQFSFPASAQTKPVPHRLGLRHAASTTTIGSEASSPLATARPSLSRQSNGPSENEPASPTSPSNSSMNQESLSGSPRSRGHESSPPAWSTLPLSRSSEGDGRTQMVSPPPPLPRNASSSARSPPHRHGSLRAKMSMPNLRSKSSMGAVRPDDSMSMLSSPVAADFGTDNETVQVKDMDFELVRPTIPQVSSPRTSEDAPSLGHLPDVRPDHAGLLRAESPANSIRSAPAGVPRPPTAVSEVSNVSTSKAPKPQDSQATMDAHRQRELKWMTVMSSTPAAQAKKSKKVKKLLFEGVPASVRYLVWAHLTDSKAKGMAGLYFQLGKRGKVSASHDIERDIRKFFMDHSQIHCTQASVAALLQAYITMVPDIQYDPGLTCIAGHLLSLSPEEDAFWIFVSLMDAFLRPYFSLNTTQMEVDGALFCKAVENNDAAVAKKIFVDMGMSPVTVCRPWFTNLFAESLPTEYLLRVWDIFFFEGIPFLFRVGLALFQCCRRQLLDATGEQAVMLNLLHPQPNSLPPTAEAFVTLAHSMKLKDDDLRKQRVKMEAQVKRQAQSRVPGGSISLPRS